MTLQFKKFLQEASLSRVHSHVQDRNIGMITAHRGENTAKENDALNKELEQSIRSAGYGFIKVKGRYIENHGTANAKAVDENSYLIVGKKGDDNGELLGFLKKHGKKYKQDSVLHKSASEDSAKLYGTREGGWPGIGKVHDVGKFHANRAGEFHTAMRGHRSFEFGESVEHFEFVRPVTFSNRKESLF
jgi:hypothetical protein